MKIFKIFKNLLSENEIPLDEEYPLTWNIEEFKKLTSFDKRIKYCNQHLRRLSSGSSRIAYQIDNEKVLKLAKNKRGLIQNENEIMLGTEKYLHNIVATVFDSDDENYLWLEMELVKPVSPQIFKNVTGFDFNYYCTVISYIDSISNRSKSLKKPEGIDTLWEDEFIANISNLISGYDVLLGDLKRLNSYGLVKRNGEDTIVVIDFGIGEEDFQTHYRK